MKLWLESFLRGYSTTDCICFHSGLRQLPTEITSPCTRLGTMDKGKGCKLATRSLREDARQWLRAKGYELPIHFQEQENREELASIEIEGDESQTPDNPSAAPLRVITEEIPNSVSAVVDATKRIGIRASVPTYIDHYGRDGIEEWFRLWILLRDDSTQFILHLCGCGICKANSRGGCCNPAHLRIGTRKEKERQKSLHRVIRITRLEDYPRVVAVVRSMATEASGIAMEECGIF